MQKISYISIPHSLADSFLTNSFFHHCTQKPQSWHFHNDWMYHRSDEGWLALSAVCFCPSIRPLICNSSNIHVLQMALCWHGGSKWPLMAHKLLDIFSTNTFPTGFLQNLLRISLQTLSHIMALCLRLHFLSNSTVPHATAVADYTVKYCF